MHASDMSAVNRAKEVTELQFQQASEMLKLQELVFEDKKARVRATIELMKVFATNFAAVKCETD